MSWLKRGLASFNGPSKTICLCSNRCKCREKNLYTYLQDESNKTRTLFSILLSGYSRLPLPYSQESVGRDINPLIINGHFSFIALSLNKAGTGRPIIS
jgi:hypothetical protein